MYERHTYAFFALLRCLYLAGLDAFQRFIRREMEGNGLCRLYSIANGVLLWLGWEQQWQLQWMGGGESTFMNIKI